MAYVKYVPSHQVMKSKENMPPSSLGVECFLNKHFRYKQKVRLGHSLEILYFKINLSVSKESFRKISSTLILFLVVISVYSDDFL